MRILYLQHEGRLWGTARSLLALIDELRHWGHECYVLLHEDGPLRLALNDRHIPSTIFRWRGWTADEENCTVRRLLHGLRCQMHSRYHRTKVLAQIEEFKPDIIHSNTIKTNLGGHLSRLLNVPHIWHMREFIGGRYSVGTEWSLGPRVTAREMSRNGQALICISEVLRQEIAHLPLSIPVYLVYNGVMKHAEMANAMSSIPPTEGGINFAFIGRFDACKEPLIPLRAMAVLRSRGLRSRLLMIGDGTAEQKDNLQSYVRENSLENCIEFPGFASDVSAVLKRIHALVMPSRGDAFGRVTAEAMAHGRPVIGADACATPELVRDRIDGLIFALGNAEALADRMQELIQHPEKMSEMGRNAAQRAQTEFTNEKYAAAIMKIYEDVLGRE